MSKYRILSMFSGVVIYIVAKSFFDVFLGGWIAAVCYFGIDELLFYLHGGYRVVDSLDREKCLVKVDENGVVFGNRKEARVFKELDVARVVLKMLYRTGEKGVYKIERIG
jgi:hypothetical protein